MIKLEAVARLSVLAAAAAPFYFDIISVYYAILHTYLFRSLPGASDQFSRDMKLGRVRLDRCAAVG